MGIPNRVEGESDDTAVTGHSALPDTEKDQRIVEKTIVVVKQHVAEAPSHKHSHQGRHGNEIGNLRGKQVRITENSKATVQKNSNNESREIGQAIPPDAHSAAEPYQEGTEIMNIVAKKHAP